MCVGYNGVIPKGDDSFELERDYPFEHTKTDYIFKTFSPTQYIFAKKWLIFSDFSKILAKISPKMQNLGQSGI